MPKYQKKYKDLARRIEALQASESANSAELAALAQEFDELVVWTENWFADLIQADTIARSYFRSVFGYNYAFPWE